MPRTLADSTLRVLDDLPPFERGSKDIQGTLDVLMREVDRIDAAKESVRSNFFPATADAQLEIYEYALGLSVNPPDKTLAQRRSTVLAFMAEMHDTGSGLDWVAAMTRLLGTAWSYKTYVPVEKRLTNLVANPSFEVNLTGWVNGSGVTSSSRITSAPAPAVGAGAVKVICGTAGGGRYFAFTLPARSIGAGTALSYSVKVQADAGSGTVRMNTFIGNGSGTPAASSSASPSITSANGWVTITGTATAADLDAIQGANATLLLFVTNDPDGGVAKTFYADAALVVAKPAAPAYFDGDTAGYEWTGTAGLSTSRATSPIPNVIEVTIPYVTQLAAPASLAGTVGSGGALTAGTYFYAVTAKNFYGETTISNVISKVVGASGKVTLTWGAVSGATSYRVYRGASAGALKHVAEVTPATYVDSGGQTPDYSPPATNTTEGFQAYEARLLARVATPAHIDLDFGYQSGFLLGISRMGDTL